jgi:anti-sigma factor RsiW
MSDPCTDLDLLLDEQPTARPELPAPLAEHAAGCGRCRERLEAHRMLAAAFADRPVPELSPGFDGRLRERISRERRRLRVLLYGYWAAALVAIGMILAAADLPSAIPEPAKGPLIAVLLLTFAGLLIPAAALFRGWVRTPGLS